MPIKYFKEKKLIIKIIAFLIMIPVLLYSSIALSFFIQYQTDGKYDLFGARPKLDIRASKSGEFDFIIDNGVWDAENIQFSSQADSNELIWEISFFHDTETNVVNSFSYGTIPQGNVFQTYPSVGLPNGTLSYDEQLSANKLSINGTKPRKLIEGEVVTVKISSYCGHSFEQPNCHKEKEFTYSKGKFLINKTKH